MRYPLTGPDAIIHVLLVELRSRCRSAYARPNDLLTLNDPSFLYTSTPSHFPSKPHIASSIRSSPFSRDSAVYLMYQVHPLLLSRYRSPMASFFCSLLLFLFRILFRDFRSSVIPSFPRFRLSFPLCFAVGKCSVLNMTARGL